jgi:hypothetical protein
MDDWSETSRSAATTSVALAGRILLQQLSFMYLAFVNKKRSQD